MANEKLDIGPALSSELITLAVAYNDALDRCTVTNGSNIEEVMEFFTDDAIRVTVGQNPAVGKTEIKRLIRTFPPILNSAYTQLRYLCKLLYTTNEMS